MALCFIILTMTEKGYKNLQQKLSKGDDRKNPGAKSRCSEILISLVRFRFIQLRPKSYLNFIINFFVEKYNP